MNLEERYDDRWIEAESILEDSDANRDLVHDIVNAWLSAGDTLYEHDGEARTSNGEYVSASEALQNAIEWGMCRVGKGDN